MAGCFLPFSEWVLKDFDVLIVGAGISGIGSAYHLMDKCPGKTYAILEGRHALGGTWDLFRYPGIRSDSDMHTLGYNFKPWREAKSIADGPAIRKYVNETASEYDIARHIRFNHMVQTADWSSEDARWKLIQATQDEYLRQYLALTGMTPQQYDQLLAGEATGGMVQPVQPPEKGQPKPTPKE